MELNKPCDNCNVVFNIQNSNKTNLFEFFTPKKNYIVWFCTSCLNSDTHLSNYINKYKRDILMKNNKPIKLLTNKSISNIIKYNDFIKNNPQINNGDYIEHNCDNCYLKILSLITFRKLTSKNIYLNIFKEKLISSKFYCTDCETLLLQFEKKKVVTRIRKQTIKFNAK
jgi:hypothetical protein